MRDFNESQTYVQHLLAEHRRLHRLLQSVRQTIAATAGACESTWGKTIVRSLCPLRDELSRHFSEEDQEGCMEEAISYCPKLASEATRIKREHPELLRELDAMIEKAHVSNGNEQDRIGLKHGFDKLCHELQAHEAAENGLLRQGFGTNVNGDDENFLYAEKEI